MDANNFATKFDVVDSKLIDFIRSELLQGLEGSKVVKAELYKLNVYGELCHIYAVACLSQAFFRSRGVLQIT
jgi:hypothetical protein